MVAQADINTVVENNWLTDYDTAINIAKKEKKNVLVYFTGSDWCRPCKVLKKDLFDSAEFAEFAPKYVLLYIDIPMNKGRISYEQLAHNKNLSAKLNKKGSVPLMVILNGKEKELGDYSGYNMNGKIGPHLKFLNKHSK